MSTARLTVSIPLTLEQKIRSRQGNSNFSAQLAQDLASYYQVIEAGMVRIERTFNQDEREVILEATKGLTWGARMIGSLIRKTLQSFLEDFSENQLNPSPACETAVEKYKKLGGLERLALIDWLTTQHQVEQPQQTEQTKQEEAMNNIIPEEPVRRILRNKSASHASAESSAIAKMPVRKIHVRKAE